MLPNALTAGIDRGSDDAKKIHTGLINLLISDGRPITLFVDNHHYID